MIATMVLLVACEGGTDGTGVALENTLDLCVDGLDNDGNGLVDVADPACTVFYNANPNPTPDPNPTPAVLSYPFGTTPSNANKTITDNLYLDWVTRFYEESGTMARIKWDKEAETVSEGIAYGMLITYFADDQDRFSKLANYYVTFRNNHNVMSWRINGFSGVSTATGSNGGASDADLDAIMAMIMAMKKWGLTAYQPVIQEGLNAIWNYYLDSDQLLCVGDTWCDPYNMSYISPVAFRAFAQVDTDPSHNWNLVLDVNYDLLMKAQTPIGIWPNWVEYDGVMSKSAGQTGTQAVFFGLESLRIPWRLFWDYAWYGDVRAKAMLDKVVGFAAGHGVTPTNIGQKYRSNTGGVFGIGSWPTTQAAFCYSWAADAVNQQNTNDCYLNLMGNTAQESKYFHSILKMAASQLLIGMWQKPAGLL